MAAISFARHQDERLNHEAWRTRVAPQPEILKPSASRTVDRVPAPKRLTREELWEQYAKRLCWYCDEPWSYNHCCRKERLLLIEPIEEEVIEHSKESLKHNEEDAEEEPQLTDVTVHTLAGYSNPQTMKGRLLMIEPIEEEVIEHSEENLEHKEDTKEEPQPTDVTVHALAGYSNPQTMKVGGILKQQPITVLIDMSSATNFLNSKLAVRIALPIENRCRFDVKVTDGRILNYDRRRPQEKLLLQDQEIIADLFLLPLNNHEAMLRIKWLTTLGDVS